MVKKTCFQLQMTKTQKSFRKVSEKKNAFRNGGEVNLFVLGGFEGTLKKTSTCFNYEWLKTEVLEFVSETHTFFARGDDYVVR